MKKFVRSPVTVVTLVDGVKQLRIGERVEYGKDPGAESPYTIALWARGELRELPFATITNERPGYLVADAWPDPGQVQIREALPSDAVDSPNIGRGIPLPLEVISTMVASPTTYWSQNVDVTMHAATDDDGFVSTMLLIAPSGMYARYDGAWIEVSNPDLFDGLNIFDVEDGALGVYDEYDQTSNAIHVGSLPLASDDERLRVPTPVSSSVVTDPDLLATAPAVTTPDEIDETPPPPPTPSDIADVPQAPVPPPLTSSGVFRPGQIKSLSDVPGAITAAAADESIRWIVERRARALGYTEEFPW